MHPSDIPLSNFNTTFISPLNDSVVTFSFAENQWIAELIDRVVDFFGSAPMLIVNGLGVDSTFGIELLASLIGLIFGFFVLKIIYGFLPDK